MNNMAIVIKRIIGTLALPAIMYLAVMWLCLSNGKSYFGTWTMWKALITQIGVSITCALGIGLQFKNGRFDFSGGSIMLLAAIIAGNIARVNGNNVWLLASASIVICVILSVAVSAVYVYGRMPIVIVTIGMALLFESLTSLVYNGAGINIIANNSLRVFSDFPMVLIPLFLSLAFYAFYGYLTVSGKQGTLLAFNQQAANNIGINEKRNVFISFIFSGVIFGFATMIYSSTGLHRGASSNLQTVGELFTNILPVFIGAALANICGDTIGIIVGSFTLCVMNFGLTAVYKAEFGAALTTVLIGVFLLLFNVVIAQGGRFKKLGGYFTARFGASEAADNK